MKSIFEWILVMLGLSPFAMIAFGVVYYLVLLFLIDPFAWGLITLIAAVWYAPFGDKVK